jgi:conjugal transfer mating pair stabilization protein TraN
MSLIAGYLVLALAQSTLHDLIINQPSYTITPQDTAIARQISTQADSLLTGKPQRIPQAKPVGKVSHAQCIETHKPSDIRCVSHLVGEPGNLHWQDNCPAHTCPLIQTTCLPGPKIHRINGEDIAQTCWAKVLRYHCANTSPCEALRAQGCTQIASHCHDGTCQQDFICQKKETISQTIPGIEPPIQPPNIPQTPSDDFERATAALSSLGEAQVDSDIHQLFQGHAQDCSDDALGFKNCCRDEGWGRDIHLAHCTPEEKALGVAKAQKRVVFIGRYCAHRAKLGVVSTCLSHHKAYCVFHSVLARLIQAQGVHQPLGAGWGSAKQPDCRGITPAQLQAIKLDQIDWHDFYDSLHHDMHPMNTEKMTQQLQSDMHHGL